jgi:hypothetical protein
LEPEMSEIQRSDCTASARHTRCRLSREQQAQKTPAKWRRHRPPMRELAHRPKQAAIDADVHVRATKPAETLNSSLSKFQRRLIPVCPGLPLAVVKSVG